MLYFACTVVAKLRMSVKKLSVLMTQVSHYSWFTTGIVRAYFG